MDFRQTMNGLNCVCVCELGAWVVNVARHVLTLEIVASICLCLV